VSGFVVDAAVVERAGEDEQLVITLLVTGMSKVDVEWLCRSALGIAIPCTYSAVLESAVFRR
jgi:hypothetical protein